MLDYNKLLNNPSDVMILLASMGPQGCPKDSGEEPGGRRRGELGRQLVSFWGIPRGQLREQPWGESEGLSPALASIL